MSQPSHLFIGENFWDRPFFQWALENIKSIGYGALLALLTLIVIYRILATQSAKDEKDYALVSQEINNLHEKGKTEAALEKLDPLLSQHPEIKPSYEGVIAQELLIQGDITLAKPLIGDIFTRVKPLLGTHYFAYSNTSLLLEEGKLEPALQEAYRLKEEILNERGENRSFEGVLYAFNLIRIALIERELNHSPEEKKAWEELRKLEKGIHEISIPEETAKRIMNHFDEEAAKLSEFIK